MSLTSYLADPEHVELRERLRFEFPKPTFCIKCDIKAEPLSKNYGIVGTAFDYLLRFTIQRHNKEKCGENNDWVAAHAFRMLLNRFDDKKKVLINERFQTAKDNCSKYLSSGKLTDKLLADALFLAKLDLYVRSGLVAPDLFIESKLDIDDLRNLHTAINIQDFIAKEQCFLNPTFGKGSMMVGGADADIILDDTLIDIKVTKHLKLERDYINQVIGYYILAIIGGINNGRSGTIIKKIGIYFARHGVLWTIPLDDLGDEAKFNSFKDWFTAYFDNLKKIRLTEINEQLATLKIKIDEEKKTKTGKSIKASR